MRRTHCLLLVALAAAAPLHAQAETAAGLCATPQSAACRQARAAHQRAERALDAQVQRVQALSRLQTAAANLGWRLDDSLDALNDTREALTATSTAIAQAQGNLRLAGTACEAALTATGGRQRAAASYREAAAGFALAKPEQATPAAAAADSASDQLRASETDLTTAAARCQAALTEGERSVAGSAQLAGRFDGWVSNVRRAAANVQAAAERMAAAAQAYRVKDAAAVNQAVRAGQQDSAAVQAWADGIHDSPSQVVQAITTAGAGPRFDAPSLLAASQQGLVADDALAFWQLTASSRARRCAEASDCLTDARATREQRTAAAERAAADLTAAQAQARNALDRLATATQAAQPDASAFMNARAATAQAMSPALDSALRERLSRSLSDERQGLQSRLTALRRAEDLAWRRAYGPRPEPASIDVEPAAGATPPRPAAAPSRIARMHAHLFIGRDAPEPPNYAAYTYVYLSHRAPTTVSPRLAETYKQTLSTIVGSTESGSAVGTDERGDYNLFCLPSSAATARNAKADAPGDWLLAEYDHAHVEHLLFHSHSGVVLREILGERVGFGPYLLTTFRPFAQTRSGDRLLYVDLSDAPAGYIPDLIESYKRRFRQAPPTEERTEWKPALAQIVVMNADRFGNMIKQLKSAAGWDVAKALGGDAKQAFVKVAP